MSQGHTYSSSAFENDLQLLKNLLQSTAHRYLVMVFFVAVTSPFMFSAAHFMGRKRRDTLTKLASQLEYGRLHCLNENQYIPRSKKGKETQNTPLSTHDNDRDSTSTEITKGTKFREEWSRGEILPREATSNSAKRVFSFAGNVEYESENNIDKRAVPKNLVQKSINGYDRLATPYVKHTFQTTDMTNANRGRKSYITSYRGSLRSDFFFKSPFASVSTSYSPKNSSIRSGSQLHHHDVQVEGTLPSDNCYPYRRKQLISRLCDDYSQMLAPLVQVILAKQRTTDGDFAHSVATTTSTFFVLKSLRSLCCMAAQDATIHVAVFCISRALARFMYFYSTGSNCAYVPQGTLADFTFAVFAQSPLNILRIARDLAASLIRDPIFTGPLSYVYLKPAQNEVPNASRDFKIDSLLDLYVFLISADSPTVRCCLPLWLVPMWRMFLFVEWIGRPAFAPWVRSQTVFDENGRSIFSYLVADRVWRGLTPKGYFVCMLLYSLPEVVTHSFLDLDWWSLCVHLYQSHSTNGKWTKVLACIPRPRFCAGAFSSANDKTLNQDNAAYLDFSMERGKWGRKARALCKFMRVASQRLSEGTWYTIKYLCGACPALATSLVDAGFCFIILSFLPKHTTKTNVSSALCHSPGIHFYVLGCLRGILIAVRWVQSRKTK